MTDPTKGSCLCGAVAFALSGPLRPIIACHCEICRKTSGHHWAATSVPWDRFTFTEQEGLRWYDSSDFARRGFCERCGSSLFYEPKGQARVSISAGCLDAPTGLRLERHVFTKDKGDYYDIADGLPCHEGFSGAEDYA